MSGNRGTGSQDSVERMASGQKLIILAIVLNLLGVALHGWVGGSAVGVMIIAFFLSLAGAFRLGAGLGLSLAARVGIVALLLVPIANVAVLLTLSASATRRLRAAGWKVGLFGATKPPQSAD